MVQIAIAIVKDTAFRASRQEFSNVYHYRAPGPGPVNNPKLLVDEVVAIEKDLHANTVTFKRYSVWSSGGTPQQNSMIEQGNLSGTGTQAPITRMDKERAILMQWPAGVNTRGKPVKLRKWFHSCGNAAGQTFADGVLANVDAIDNSTKTPIDARCNDLRIIGPVDEWLLVAASGREHTGPGQIHKFLEHHQLGNQWR